MKLALNVKVIYRGTATWPLPWTRNFMQDVQRYKPVCMYVVMRMQPLGCRRVKLAHCIGSRVHSAIWWTTCQIDSVVTAQACHDVKPAKLP